MDGQPVVAEPRSDFPRKGNVVPSWGLQRALNSLGRKAL